MQNRVEEDLLYEVRDGIGLITFNRPAAHNALTFDMYDRLGDICGEVGLGGAVKAIIVTGTGGRAFAAGTDISLFQNFSTAQQGVDYEITVVDADVTCSCAGFEYRGQCRHARDIKAALAAGRPVPAQYAEVSDDATGHAAAKKSS